MMQLLRIIYVTHEQLLIAKKFANVVM